MTDLADILKVLHDAKLVPKWKDIGQTLRISDEDLDTFIDDDTSFSLLRMVVSWLEGNSSLRDDPSWWRLMWAVADPHGGDKPREGMRIATMIKGELQTSQGMPLYSDKEPMYIMIVK